MAGRVVISGATGFVGSRLSKTLLKHEYEIVAITRQKKAEGLSPFQLLEWRQERLIREALEGAAGVINLAGESIAAFRYSEKKRRSIMQSRLFATKNLAAWSQQCEKPPTAFISASAVGYYGNRGEEIIDEQSAPGSGFLAEVCQAWELAAQSVHKKTRLVTMRLGVVLDPAGGILKNLHPLYAAHLGMNMGSGRQWFSWIHLKDLIQSILKFLEDPAFKGVYNLCSPHPIRFAEFHRALQVQSKTRSFLKQPEWLLRLLMGDAASLLLDSTRGVPKRLLQSGFNFELDTIGKALAASTGNE